MGWAASWVPFNSEQPSSEAGQPFLLSPQFPSIHQAPCILSFWTFLYGAEKVTKLGGLDNNVTSLNVAAAIVPYGPT